MSQPVEVLALIPARGGSKGIPRKNIKLLNGYPLIAYSIAAAQQSDTVTRIIVSTDDEEIADVARQYGAEVPFMRPAEHAQDNTRDFPVFDHALRWLAKHEDYHPEIVIQLRPTTPIRPPSCIDDAVQILLDHPEATCVRGVMPSGENPYKMWRLSSLDEPMTPLIETDLYEQYNMPRQELPPTYWQSGHIDAIRSRIILDEQTLSGDTIYPLLIDRHYEVDIDNEHDWQQAVQLVNGGIRVPYVKPTQTPIGNRVQQALRDVKLMILDFDGVLTDNRVLVAQDGTEYIMADRGDGMGISLVRDAGVSVRVLSREENPVVAARCRKLKIDYQHGVLNKLPALKQILEDEGLTRNQVIYVGNDINDRDCLEYVGLGVIVADAHPSVHDVADYVLQKNGGYGAVRDLCDQIIAAKQDD